MTHQSSLHAPGPDQGPAAGPTIEQMLASGMALIRVPRGAKKPLEAGWNRPERAIRTTAGAKLLEGTNIGLAHAYCTPNPTGAIDIDDYNGAKGWLSTRGVDLEHLLFAHDAVVIWSGTPKRLKLLYRLPAGQVALKSTTVKAASGKMLLELRCATATGLTVHDLLPPSVHPSGRTYQWMGEGNPLAPPDLPLSLLSLWRGMVTPRMEAAELSRRNRAHLDSARDETPRAIANLRDMLQYISADCDYAEWRNVVWAILSTGWRCGEDLARDWSMTAPHRFDEGAFMNVVSSHRPDRDVSRRVGTIMFFARMGGWNG